MAGLRDFAYSIGRFVRPVLIDCTHELIDCLAMGLVGHQGYDPAYYRVGLLSLKRILSWLLPEQSPVHVSLSFPGILLSETRSSDSSNEISGSN